MKFETPRMDINAFSENIMTAASGIENSDTVNTAKDTITQNNNKVAVNNILTFTLN